MFEHVGKLQSSLVQMLVQMIKAHAALKCAGRQKKAEKATLAGVGRHARRPQYNYR